MRVRLAALTFAMGGLAACAPASPRSARSASVPPPAVTPGDTNPRLVALPIVPLPIPSKVRGFRLDAVMTVDSTGKVSDVQFTPTPDAAYNRRLHRMFREFKFEPGRRLGGTPIAGKYSFRYEF